MEVQFRNVPDGLWEQIAPLIPARRKNTLRGRPPVPDREVLAGIVYRLRTGCQWKALPKESGSGSTARAPGTNRRSLPRPFTSPARSSRSARRCDIFGIGSEPA
ncbi:MAG TPA: transposase [Anaeromyxobacteraceae bacterium]|nr:transposase [Anaeromyxobacteraceae bacterium]